MYYRKYLAIVLATTGLAGCLTAKNPHNDVMVFGTTTTLGAKVGSEVQNATVPSIEFGYNRLEAVWMPLRENGVFINEDGMDSQTVHYINNVRKALKNCISTEDENTVKWPSETDNAKKAKEAKAKEAKAKEAKDKRAKDIRDFCAWKVGEGSRYQGRATITDTDGKKEDIIDTYSVFASFGARGGGKSSTNNQEINGAIAQFFATGIAAQKLAENPQVGVALNSSGNNAVIASEETKTSQAILGATISQNTRNQFVFAAITRQRFLNKYESNLKNCYKNDLDKLRSNTETNKTLSDMGNLIAINNANDFFDQLSLQLVELDKLNEIKTTCNF